MFLRRYYFQALLMSPFAVAVVITACQGMEQGAPLDVEARIMALAMDDLAGQNHAEHLRRVLYRAGVGPVEHPPDQDPALVELGRNLFFDRELSGRRNISCATCHNPMLGSADGQSQSRGQGTIGLGPARRQNGDEFFEFLPRNALSLWNRGVPGWDVMFWDGRLGGNSEDGFFSPAGDDTPQDVTNALALFSIIPITPDQEMRGFPGQLDIFGNENEVGEFTNEDFPLIWERLVDRIVSIPGYIALIADAFPGKPLEDVTLSDLVNALGAFQTEAFTALDSPFDRYLAGENNALSKSAKRGALIFYGRGKCANCHSGALQTDFAFHNVAAPQAGGGRKGFEPLDLGREETTGVREDRFKFRTPSLRNVELEGPWFHNGAYAKLEDAVRHHLHPADSLTTYDDSQLEPELVGTFVDDTEIISELLATISPALCTPRCPQVYDHEVKYLMDFISSLTDPGSLNKLDLVPDSVPSGLPLNH